MPGGAFFGVGAGLGIVGANTEAIEPAAVSVPADGWAMAEAASMAKTAASMVGAGDG